MHVIGRKALRTFFLFCLPMLLSATILHSATEDSWEILESEHFQIYYQPDESHPQDIADIAEDFYPHLDRLIDGIEIGKIEIWMCRTPAAIPSRRPCAHPRLGGRLRVSTQPPHCDSKPACYH